MNLITLPRGIPVADLPDPVGLLRSAGILMTEEAERLDAIERATSESLGLVIVPSAVAGHAKPAHVKRAAVVGVRSFNLDASGAALFAGIPACQYAILDGRSDLSDRSCRDDGAVRVVGHPAPIRLSCLFFVGEVVAAMLAANLFIFLSIPTLAVRLPSLFVVGVLLSFTCEPLGAVLLMGPHVGRSLAGPTSKNTPTSMGATLEDVAIPFATTPWAWRDGRLGGRGTLIEHREIHPLAVSRPRPVDAGCGGFMLPLLYQEIAA